MVLGSGLEGATLEIVPAQGLLLVSLLKRSSAHHHYVQRFAEPNHREKLITENAAATFDRAHAVVDINSSRLRKDYTLSRKINFSDST